MDNDKFIKLSKELVRDYVNEHLDVTDNVKITENNVYCVTLSKVLGNNKGLFSTTLPDGMYYEVTYNGSNGKNEIYIDAYKKFENVCIKLEEK